MAGLSYKVIELQQQHDRLERNIAIALLSAEIANDKIGTFAPFFGEDREKFARLWINGTNLPLAVFDGDVIYQVRRQIELNSNTPAARQMYDDLRKAPIGR